MRRRKKLALVLCLCLLLPLLTACHGAQESTAFTVPASFDATRDYEITFWAKNDTNKTQVDIYNQAVSDFEALYPNIRVTLRLYTDYSRIYNDVITNISTNTTPNVCITYPDHIATYLTGNHVVVPLDELMQDERYGLGGSEVRFDAPSDSDVVPKFLEECRIGGTLYALPYMRSTEALYINKTFVEKLGYTVPETVTWDWIWEVSEAAMAKDEEGLFAVNGQKVMIPFIYKSTDNMMISMLRQAGAGYSDEEGHILIFNETADSLLREIYAHAQSRAFSTFKISSYPANFLNAGQSIFAIDSTAGATWMGSDAPLSDIAEDQVVRFETVVKTIPQMDPSNPQMISQGPSVCLFNKQDPQEVLASWLFAQYLLTDQVQMAYSETEGYVPVTLQAQRNPAYTDYLSREGEDTGLHYAIKIRAARLLLDNIGHTFVTPVFNGSASLREAAGQMIESAAKSARRKEEMNDAYLEKLHSDMISLYRLDQIGAAQQETEGKLPEASVALLASLAGIWVLMLSLRGLKAIRQKRRQKDEKHE